MRSGAKADSFPGWRYAVALLVILAVVRSPVFFYPILDEDEAIHAAIGSLIASGERPYLDGTDGKFPFLWYQYAAVFKIFGLYNMVAVHALTLIAVWATALLLAAVGTRLKGPGTGRWAGLLYATFTTASFYKILGSNFELHMLPWECAGAWLVLVGLNKPREMFFWMAAGACVGLSILTKQQGGMMLATLPIAVFAAFRQSLRRLAAGALWLGLGAALVGLLFLLFAQRQGYLDEMLYWTVTYPQTYIGIGKRYIAGMTRSVTRIGFWIVGSLPLWLAAGRTLRRELTHPLTRFALVWLLLSWVPVSLGGRYYAHYFLLNLPGLVLLAAPAVAGFFASQPGPFTRRVVMALAFLPIAVFLAGSWALPLVKKWEGIVVPDYPELGREIAALVPENERIFVWGWAPEFYVFSKRLPAGRFVYGDPLSGRIPGSSENPEIASTYRERILPGAWERLAEDFARHPPSLIIDAAALGIHDYRPYPLEQYPWLINYVGVGYRKTVIDGIPMYVRQNGGSLPTGNFDKE